MSWVSAGVAVGSLAVGIYSSEKKKAQAKKKEKEAGQRPVYNIQEPTLKNQFMAENLAQQGMADESRMMYEQQANRGLSESLDALLKVGGGVNSVSDLYSTYQDKNAELATLNDQIKFRNQQILANQNQQLSNEMDKVYSLNKLDPWKDQQQAVAELRTMAQADMQGGISGATQAGLAFSSNANKKWGGVNNGSAPTGIPTTTSQMPQNNTMDDVRGIYDPMYRKPTPNSYFLNNGQNADYNTNYYLSSLGVV